MPSEYVIHTVGPVWNGGSKGEPEKLANCYTNSLKLAVENNCRIIAFPNISTGVYGYPKNAAAEVAVKAVSGFLAETNRLEKVIFVCFDEENEQFIRQELKNAGEI